MVSTAFEKAVIEVEMIGGSPSNDDKLLLYALFKIANGEEAKKAGMFDMVGKAKYNKWDEVRKEVKTPEEAETKYIEKVEALKAAHGFDGTRTKMADGKAIDQKKLDRYKELTS